MNSGELSRAFSIFLEELRKGLKEANAILSAESVPSSEDSKYLSAYFHRMKGGAGCLGLCEIEPLAREIEKSLADVPIKISELRALLARLEEEYNKLCVQTEK